MAEECNRILVVDDDEMMRDSLYEMLSHDAYLVTCVDTAEKALKKMKTWPVHLFIVDLKLPGMSGINMLKKLDVMNNIYEAIILTAYGDMNTAKEAMELGACSYVAKPVEYKKLAPRVKKALEIVKQKKVKLDYLNELESKIRERTKKLEREIEQRKQAELALREQRKYAESIVNTAQVIVLVLDKKGKIVNYNPYMEEIAGYTINEVKGKDWFDTFLPERDRSRIRVLFKTAVGDTQTRGNINSIVTKDGREREIEWYDKTLKDDNGEIVGLLAVGQDVTERIKVDRALKENNRFLIDLISSIRDGVFVLDENGVHITVNPAFCRMTGFKKKELIGTGLPHPYWPEEEYDNIQNAFKQILNEDFKEIELVFKRKNDERFPVLINPSSVKDFNGKTISYFAIVKDIKEKKKAEEVLRENERKLYEQNIMLNEKNIALREVMDQLEAERDKVAAQVNSNVDRFIFPLISKMRTKGSDIDKTYFDLLEENLKELTSQFADKMSEKMFRLTQKEIELCNMIKRGMTSKEIANLLNISHRTVETHRNNIRKKLGIGKTDTNLVTYLKNM